jgi:hypothetical protein
MKQGKYSIFRSIISIAVFLTVISISSMSFGGTKDSTNKANTTKTIIMGINSPIPGVAQGSIYLVGYYGFTWAVDPLINVLNDSSKETFIRIMAAYSLYMVGEEKGIEAIKTTSAYDKDYMLQTTCELIYKNYLNRIPGKLTAQE